MFWGLLFLVIGAILVIQNVFNIDLPILRICFGVLLIYWGLQVVFGSFGMKFKTFHVNSKSSSHEAVFATTMMKSHKEDGSFNSTFTTAFGSSQIDLSGLSAEDLKNEIKIENAFGHTKILTNKNIPVQVKVSAGFSSVEVRGVSFGAFGDDTFQTENLNTAEPYLKLKIESGFGKVIVE